MKLQIILKMKKTFRPANLAAGSPGKGFGIYLSKDQKFKLELLILWEMFS